MQSGFLDVTSPVLISGFSILDEFLKVISIYLFSLSRATYGGSQARS